MAQFKEIETKKGTYVINAAHIVHYRPAPGGYKIGGIITYLKGQVVDELELNSEEAQIVRNWLKDQ